jgi:crotonobetainyl-CoA:carnitine CoA-transferase CaiB-like acyl-CoA transferase
MRSNEWFTEAFSGFTSITGSKGGPGEFSRGTANLDWNGAMINAVALLAALVRRERGGGGGYFLTSQLGSSVYGGITRYAGVLAGEPQSPPLGAACPDIAPDDAFRTRDGEIVVSAPTERCWVRLCDALNLQSLQDDPRFSTNAARIEAREELNTILGEVFARETSITWHERLSVADIPYAPVPHGMSLLDGLQSHPQIVGEKLFVRVPSHYGSIASQAPHWRFERTPASIEAGPPLLGEHTELVLSNLGSKAGLITSLAAAREKAKGGAMVEAV